MGKAAKLRKALKEKIFSDCGLDVAFWLCNGQVIKNIRELIDAIEKMDSYAFAYHVNQDNNKNDFAKWICDVLGDFELARRLTSTFEKESYLQVIKNRVSQFEHLK